MTNTHWFLLIGALLLVMGLTSSLLKSRPVTSAIIYLAVGVLVGRRPIAGSCGGLAQCGLKLECATCPNHHKEGAG